MSLLYKEDLKFIRSLNSIVENFHMLSKHMGTKTAIKVHKETERIVKLFLLGQNPQPDYPIWMKMVKGTPFPRYIKYRGKIPEDSPGYERALLSALAYYRLYRLPVDDDISTITTPGRDLSESFLQEIEEFSADFFKSRGIKPFEPQETSFPAYATTKAGASKGPAMGLASLKDILSLEKENLLTKVRLLGSMVYSEDSYAILEEIIESSLTIAKSSDFQTSSSGRLHLLAEGGGKTRVICIPDIWSQSVLKPIHSYLMDHVLKRMPCDGTFGHESIGNRVRNLTQHRGLYCFDLRAASDRFPLEIQKAVLKPLLGDKVHAWSDLLVNRTFTFKSKEIRYAVGQPMGFLSSWAAMSVAHHILINYSKRDKSPYAMIGDDMGMVSEEGARRYQSLMKEIGVSINDAKSLIPKSGTRVAEIAKRQFREGREISPIPPRVLMESTRSLPGLLEFLSILASRTAKFRALSELERDNVINLILSNKDRDTDAFQVTLSCPLIMYNPFGPYMDLVAPAVERGNLSRWNKSFPTQTYQGELERFLLEEASKQVNMHPIALELSMISTPPRRGNNPSTPLLESYLSDRKKYLENILRNGLSNPGSPVRAVPNPDPDLYVMGIQEIWKEIVSGPDYNSPKDFMEKRVIRQKQTIDLLMKYYSYSMFARIPDKKP